MPAAQSVTSSLTVDPWVSLGVVAVLIPATIFGLGIGTEVVFREGSTRLCLSSMRFGCLLTAPSARAGFQTNFRRAPIDERDTHSQP